MWTDAHCHWLDDHGHRTSRRAGATPVAEARGRRRRTALRRPSAPTLAHARAPAVAHAPRRHDGVWATAGVHPHDAVDGRRRPRPTLLDEPEVVAVGECGLDYHYDHSPRPVQRDVFAAQVALAHAHDLALVIHTREAWDDTFAILAAEGVPERTVFHCFTGGPAEARRAPRRGADLSASAASSRSRAPTTSGPRPPCARSTGCWSRPTRPSWRPCPTAGRPNRPAWVPLVGAAVAAAKGVPVEPRSRRRPRRPPPSAVFRAGRRERDARRPRRASPTCSAATGSGPSRALGQNFVVDPNTVRRIARLAGVGPGDRVVEIGAGLGSLTLALPETGAAVTAVEIDRHLLPVLRRGGRAGRGHGRGGRRPRASTGRTLLGDEPLGPGGQPALQRGHAAGARPARRGARHRAACW